jgi:hypothetical protein
MVSDCDQDFIGITLDWTMLDRKGNSHQGERIDLLDDFLTVFPEIEVAYLTGDREFVGHQLTVVD